MQYSSTDTVTEIQKRLDMVSTESLVLDFDGTVTSPLQDPKKERLHESTRNALVDVLHSKRVSLHADLGQSLDDVISNIGLDAGAGVVNHGVEIVGRYTRYIDPIASTPMVELWNLTDKIGAALRSINGVRIEFKQSTATVHYGEVAANEMQAVRNVVEKMVAQHSPNARLRSGADSFDLLPPTSWNRGSVEIWLNECGGAPLKLELRAGEGRSDADVLHSLSEGITVHAGDDSANEDMFLSNDSEDVVGFLQWIAQRTKE